MAIDSLQFVKGDKVCLKSPAAESYLEGRVGTVVGPRLIARAYEIGRDDLGVLDVDFGRIEGYGDVHHQAHVSHFELAGVRPSQETK